MEEKNVETKEANPKKKSKFNRTLIVILFITVFVLVSYISLRGSYFEFVELGERYVDVLDQNLRYKYSIMLANFVVLFVVIYFTNRGIKKGLKSFFDEEKKEMPKLPNKSIALVVSALVSIVISNYLVHKVMLFGSNTWFGLQDLIFEKDIAYYMFQKPLIEFMIIYFMALVIGLTAYTAVYYIIVFNKYFDGVSRETLKNSKLIKVITRNILFFAIGLAAYILIKNQDIVLDKFITLGQGTNATELIGAGFTEVTVKLWGYRILALVVVVSVFLGIRYFKKGNSRKVIMALLAVPSYLVLMFVVLVGFEMIFINSNELDKEKDFIAENIRATRNAYSIEIDEANLENTGTITLEEVENNQDVINNIPIVSEDVVLESLKDSQTNSGYYMYRSANIAKYEIDGKDTLVYVSAREIASGNRTYESKTYEYTHGNGLVITSPSSVTEPGNVKYLQKNIEKSENDLIDVDQSRIYFGLETDSIIATNTSKSEEYDYTDVNSKDVTYTYEGEAGLKLNFIDRLILGIKKGDLKIALNGNLTSDSKILINRNVIERARKALPYVIYDEDPYTVVTDDGRIVWVIDAYTTSSNYPYSTKTTIEHDGVKEKINYIRNSIKVIIDSYDGTVKYYITDKTDPIAMAYKNIYPSLFETEEIPQDIAEHFVYPEFLYSVQSEMLKQYHNVKSDVLYRSDDVWDIAMQTTTKTLKSTGTKIEPYYAMVKTVDSDEATLGLIIPYTSYGKQNVISYLVGTYDDNKNLKLTLYKFSSDSNILGPMQLDNQIEQDAEISEEINALNVTGSKVIKDIKMIPINNTFIYVESIYQVMLNESQVPILKKIVVSSGSKVAIGDTISEALKNLLSQYAVEIEVENTEDIEGLIEAIIKANENLKQSTQNSDWELMGKDVKKLQDLIDSLNAAKEAQEAEEKSNTDDNVEENNQANTNENTTNILNDVNKTESATNEVEHSNGILSNIFK